MGRSIRLDTWILDHEIEQANFDLLGWTKKRIVSELHHHAPHGPETISRWRDHKLKAEVFRIEAEWKEPVQ